jgi:hypothetical protein
MDLRKDGERPMKTTVEVPDELFRRVKAEAALRGKPMKDLVEEGLRLMLDKSARAGEGPTVGDLMKDYIGIVDSGVTDLSTNPKYMEGFGEDGSRDR